MTPTATATRTSADLRTDATPTCCRRPMTSIEVTTRGTALVLHSCPTCARHQWRRDGRPAGRDDLFAGVQTFLAQPRVPTPRTRRTAAAPA